MWLSLNQSWTKRSPQSKFMKTSYQFKKKKNTYLLKSSNPHISYPFPSANVFGPHFTMKTITIRRDSSCIPKSTICFLLPKRNPQCLLFLQTSLPQIQFFLKTPALLFWFPFNPFWRVTLVYYSEFFPSTFSLNVYESILFPIIAMENLSVFSF